MTAKIFELLGKSEDELSEITRDRIATNPNSCAGGIRAGSLAAAVEELKGSVETIDANDMLVYMDLKYGKQMQRNTVNQGLLKMHKAGLLYKVSRGVYTAHENLGTAFGSDEADVDEGTGVPGI